MMDSDKRLVNPNDFVITRKRKKYKFAKFANAKNCLEYDEWIAQGKSLLTGQSLYVEVGAGNGLFSVELASRHPEKIFVAVDIKADRLQKGAYRALELGLANIYFVRARADQLDTMFVPASVRIIWVTFPDPFPKKRSAGRRLTHPTYLSKYAVMLQKNGVLRVKHDNPAFFQWSIEQLVREKWIIQELTFDLHNSDYSDEYKIKTSYEEKWLREGRITQLVCASK